MKHLAIILLAFALNLSVLNASFFSNKVETSAPLSIELNVEKMDVSEASDSYDDPYFYLIRAAYIPMDVSSSQLDFSSFYAYEKIFILLEPPAFNLFV